MPLISTTISADFHLESVYDEVTGCSTWQSSSGHQFNRENGDFFHSFFVSHNPTDSMFISRTDVIRGVYVHGRNSSPHIHTSFYMIVDACMYSLFDLWQAAVPWISQSMKTYSGHFHLCVVQFVPSVSVCSIEQFTQHQSNREGSFLRIWLPISYIIAACAHLNLVRIQRSP
jgi:hypothetical protein